MKQCYAILVFVWVIDLLLVFLLILVSCHFGWFKQVRANMLKLWLQGLGFIFLGLNAISSFLLFSRSGMNLWVFVCSQVFFFLFSHILMF
jgi:hypothetical protein